MAASSGHNFWSRVERNLPKDGTRRRWQRALRLPTHPIYRSVLEFQSVWLIRTLQARHQCCATLQSTGVRARLPQTCGKQAQTSTALQSCPSWTAIILPHIPVNVQCSPIARHDTNRNYDIRKRRWRRRRTFSKEEKSGGKRKKKKIKKKRRKRKRREGLPYKSLACGMCLGRNEEKGVISFALKRPCSTKELIITDDSCMSGRASVSSSGKPKTFKISSIWVVLFWPLRSCCGCGCG